MGRGEDGGARPPPLLPALVKVFWVSRVRMWKGSIDKRKLRSLKAGLEASDQDFVGPRKQGGPVTNARTAISRPSIEAIQSAI